MPRIFQSLIQSDFGGGAHGNFEAVVQEGDTLVHWWRDNASDGFFWKRGQVIVPSGVLGAGAIIQSDFGAGSHKNFEVLVPIRGGDGRAELWHFFHENSNVANPWRRGQRVTGGSDNVAGPAGLIQADFGSGRHKNFEVVVPLLLPNGHVELRHFFHNNADVSNPWQKDGVVTGPADEVAGPGSLIQSNFGGGKHKNFEVLVPLRTPTGEMELWHFFHDNSNVSNPWQRAQRVIGQVTGPAVIIQSDFGSGPHKNFEALVPQGRRLTHFWHDNSNVGSPWQQGQVVSESLEGWASLMRSNFGAGAHKNFESLVEECEDSLIGYWHSNVAVTYPWLRDKPVIARGYPPEHRLPDTQKIVQLTGEFDRQGWNGTGTPPFAHNRTESRFGIRGTDLGVSFEHGERTYFMFGDTWRVGQSADEVNLDSIAFTTDTAPEDGLDLTFLPQPPRIVPPVNQKEFNVPLDGVSHDGAMFVFFSVNHFRFEHADVMGGSLLTRCDDEGQTFKQLYPWSSGKFINVSVQRARLTLEEMRQSGVASPDVLCVWGSGRYRSSDVFLALIPMFELETGQGRRFYAGWNGAHQWSSNEEDATPLICAGCVGELSVRWNEPLQRYLLMYNSDNPSGIVMHAAPKPWGPFTHDPVMVFDPWFHGAGLDPADPCLGDGYGKFMHVSWAAKQCDHDFDDMFGSSRENEWGGAYGPYQIANMTRDLDGVAARIYFTMSTWNPYQSMLMATNVPIGLIERLEPER